MADDSVLEQAIILHSAGFPVILTDHQKNPGFVGGEWQNYKWTAKKFATWLATRPNLQLGLKLWPIVDIEIDAPPDDDGSFVKEATRELRDLAGYVQTPSWTSRRGRHWLFKVTDAQRVKLEAMQCPAVVKSGRLEFRLGCSKAAQSLIPPSTTDEFQRKWVDDLATTPILVMPDRMFDLIHAEAELHLEKAKQAEEDEDGVGFQRPGDVFNEQATWDEILSPHGWRAKGNGGEGVRYWTRPGKQDGISATTGYCKSTLRDDCFYSFSNAAEIEPFEAQRSYSKFEAFAFLEHDGDFSLASADLARRGFVPDQPDGSEFETLPAEEPEAAVAPPSLNTSRVPAPPSEPPPPSRELPASVYDNPIGRYVLANDPHTEADKNSVLLQSWELFGNFIGRDVRFRLNNSTLYANDFLVVVGASSFARKGTSWNDALAPYKFNEPELEQYEKNRIEPGIATGEGLISRVADSPTFTDGRLIASLGEMKKLMVQINRAENIISAILREAYDGGRLSVATKTNPLVASQAHFSMVMHTTEAEFSEQVQSVDVHNGVLNRMMFYRASDGKVLPNPGRVDAEVLEGLSKHLVKCREWVLEPEGGRELYWSEDAMQKWEEAYRVLRKPTHDPIADAFLARGATHVMKMAIRHAVLDMSDAVQLSHLENALTIWSVIRSCTLDLMNSQNPLTDDRAKLWNMILDKGDCTKTECYKFFGNNKGDGDISGMLDYLAKLGKIRKGKVNRGGRKYDGWLAT